MYLKLIFDMLCYSVTLSLFYKHNAIFLRIRLLLYQILLLGNSKLNLLLDFLLHVISNGRCISAD